MDDDFSHSVAWETNPPPPSTSNDLTSSATDLEDVTDYSPSGPSSAANQPPTSASTKPNQSTSVNVKDGKIELEGTKDMFVSYLVTATNESGVFQTKQPSSRRRFQDFTFLRSHLVKDFPAAVVPPLPEKHRMEYVVGDRFSNEFIERRRVDLERFLERLARHPNLSRTELFRNFVESTEWNVFKHKHTAHPSDPEPPAGLLDNLSDTLLNAFAKLKKPDERFVEMRAQLDHFEEGLASIERLGARNKTRLADLAGDYEDLANSVQGLGYLESGITEPLMRFERALVDFGNGVREHASSASDPFLEHLHALLAYSGAFKSVLKLRDQKQLDFEELNAYLANVVSERDRLVGGYGYGLGLSSYFKEKVDSLRGDHADGSKEARLARLDTKIKELSDAVTHSEQTSIAFNAEVVQEHQIFNSIKRIEMKQLLGSFTDTQIALQKASIASWDKALPMLTKGAPSAAAAAAQA